MQVDQGSRTKNSIRNAIWAVLLNICVIIFPFIIRTVVLKIIGEETLGIMTLYKSIIQVLSLANLGMSSAICASLYKPIIDNNTEEICGIVYLCRKLFKIIALVILSAGFLVIPFLNILTKGQMQGNTGFYVLWVLYLIDTVASYLLFVYYEVLLNALQRNDIARKIDIIIRIFEFALQLYVIIVYKSVIFYIIIKILHTVVYSVWCAYESRKLFPDYKPIKHEIKDSEKIFSNMKSLAIQKIGNTVSVSLDAVIISAFMGVTTVAIYGNYNYIIQAIISFLAVICYATVASVGNSIASNNIEKNMKDFRQIVFLNSWIVGWCSVCFMCVFQSFMVLWAGEKLTFTLPVVLTLVLRFYSERIRSIVLVYKDAIGLWDADKWRPLVGCIVNLILNVALVKSIGVAGVAISTIVSFTLIEMPWETHALFNGYFKCKELNYYKELALSFISMTIAGIVTYIICDKINIGGIYDIAIKLVICLVVPNVIFVILNLKNDYFAEACQLIGKILSTMLKRKQKS